MPHTALLEVRLDDGELDTRVLVWELRELAEKMRADDSPHADDLDRILEERFGHHQDKEEVGT